MDMVLIVLLFGLPSRLMSNLVVYRELYVSKVLATDLADMVLELEAEDGNIKYGVLDSSLWHKRGDTGPSLAEQMISKDVVGVHQIDQKVHV